MRKVSILILVILAVAVANPLGMFTTHTPYRPRKGTGYAGGGFFVPISLGETDSTASFKIAPTLKAGYGISHRFDATFMVDALLSDQAYVGSIAALEGRYKVVSREHFSLYPVLGLYYIYLNQARRGKHTFGVGPGLGASVEGVNITIRAEFQLAFFLSTDGLFGGGGLLLLTPDVRISKNFSVFAEIANPFVSSTPIFCPGVSWTPTDRLNLTAAVSLPSDFSYVAPSISTYFLF